MNQEWREWAVVVAPDRAENACVVLVAIVNRISRGSPVTVKRVLNVGRQWFGNNLLIACEYCAMIEEKFYRSKGVDYAIT